MAMTHEGWGYQNLHFLGIKFKLPPHREYVLLCSQIKRINVFEINMSNMIRYNGLNICVPPSIPNSYVKILTPS